MKHTTGRKYRCDNPTCVKHGLVWITPVNMMTAMCVCDESPTFIGYVEEEGD
jgi:hypothetical protein